VKRDVLKNFSVRWSLKLTGPFGDAISLRYKSHCDCVRKSEVTPFDFYLYSIVVYTLVNSDLKDPMESLVEVIEK
jgi:hypothetical protein